MLNLVRYSAFTGPNAFSMRPVSHLVLEDTAGAALAPTALTTEVLTAIAREIPGLQPDRFGHHPSAGELTILLANALQTSVGWESSFAQAYAEPQSGSFVGVYGFLEPVIALAAAHTSVQMVNAALTHFEAGDVAEIVPAIDRLRSEFNKQAKTNGLGNNVRRLTKEAERRDIPWLRLSGAAPVILFGQGAKQRRFLYTVTDQTSQIASSIATNKALAAEIMRNNGIPVPRHEVVVDEESAVAAALRIGYPVVIKPVATDKGVGVSKDNADEEAVRRNFRNAGAHGPVLVEQQIIGRDFRLTVVKGRLAAVSSNYGAQVRGDGISTIATLVDRANAALGRSDSPLSPARPITIDDEATGVLAEQGYDRDSVPAADVVVKLRHWWRQSSDGLSDDVTDIIHPANRLIAERAARVIGLDLAGVDLIVPDITLPWYECGGAINEINPAPGLNGHLRAGSPDIMRLVLDGYFPEGENGRIPLVATGRTSHSAAFVEIVSAMLAAAGHSVGSATQGAVKMGGKDLTIQTQSDLTRAQIVVRDPQTSAAVVELAPGSIAVEGAGFDRCTIGVVTGLPETAAYGLAPDIQYKLLGAILEATSELAILNAEDEACVSLMSRSGARRLCLVGRDLAMPRLAEHIGFGGIAVGIQAGGGAEHLVVINQKRTQRICGFARPTMNSVQRDDAIALLAATAAGYGLGLQPATLASALIANSQRIPLVA